MVINPNDFSKIYSWFYLKVFYKLFDGMWVISGTLLNYYKPLVRKHTKLFHLPMTVDPRRFDGLVESKKDTFDITYCGALNHTKDGILNLIDSYFIVFNKIPNTRLLLIGKNNNKALNELILEKINKYNLNKHVLILGFVHRDEIPRLLYNSDLLVLSRPNNKQAEGGFPTKLGEYLMTGKPVVVTKVGEIPEYLKDRENAYLSEPDDIVAFADKMIEAIYDKNSLCIGAKGKELALEVFNYQKQISKLNRELNHN